MKRMLLLSAALAGAVLVALMCGSFAISPREIFMVLTGADGYAVQRTIMQYVRLPRVCAAVIAGAGLSLSGTLLQAVTLNPLAGPNLIGVNAGAGLGTVLMLAFAPSLYALLPAAAFAGAMIALMLVMLIARAVGGGRHSVILAGVALTAFFGAGITLVSFFDTDVYAVYTAFAVGSLANVAAESLLIPAVTVAVCFISALTLSFRLEALSFGDDRAGALGIRPSVLRASALTIAALSAASAVSFAGLLGFVGLVVPHIAEAVTGTGLRRKLMSAPIIGAVIVLIADTAGRTLFAPSEIAAGVITSIAGAPAFMALLLIKRRAERD